MIRKKRARQSKVQGIRKDSVLLRWVHMKIAKRLLCWQRNKQDSVRAKSGGQRDKEVPKNISLTGQHFSLYPNFLNKTGKQL